MKVMLYFLAIIGGVCLIVGRQERKDGIRNSKVLDAACIGIIVLAGLSFLAPFLH